VISSPVTKKTQVNMESKVFQNPFQSTTGSKTLEGIL